MTRVVRHEHRVERNRVTGDHRVHAADRRAGSLQAGSNSGEGAGAAVVPGQGSYVLQESIDQLGQPMGSTRQRRVDPPVFPRVTRSESTFAAREPSSPS